MVTLHFDQPKKTLQGNEKTYPTPNRFQPEKKSSTQNTFFGELRYKGVSENGGFSPQIIHFTKVFHYKIYKPSILGFFPLFLETPICDRFPRGLPNKQLTRRGLTLWWVGHSDDFPHADFQGPYPVVNFWPRFVALEIWFGSLRKEFSQRNDFSGKIKFMIWGIHSLWFSFIFGDFEWTAQDLQQPPQAPFRPMTHISEKKHIPRKLTCPLKINGWKMYLFISY